MVVISTSVRHLHRCTACFAYVSDDEIHTHNCPNGSQQRLFESTIPRVIVEVRCGAYESSEDRPWLR